MSYFFALVLIVVWYGVLNHFAFGLRSTLAFNLLGASFTWFSLVFVAGIAVILKFCLGGK